MFSAKPIARSFLFFLTILILVSPSSSPVLAAVGTLNLTGSTASFSSSLTQGSNIPIRTAFGPLRFDFKNGPDSYQTGMLMREGDGNVAIGSNIFSSDIGTSKLSVKGAGTTSTTSGLNVTNSGGTSALYVRDDGYVGIGLTTPTFSTAKFEQTATFTDAATDSNVHLQTLMAATGANVGGTSRGTTIRTLTSGAYNYTGSLRALEGAIWNNGSGTITNAIGFLFSGGTFSTGNITDLKAARLENYSLGGGGTVGTTTGLSIGNLSAYNSPTTVYGINIDANTTANGTSKYGINIGNISGAATNNYSIYTGTAQSYFGGHIGVGPNGSGNLGQQVYIGNTSQDINSAVTTSGLGMDVTVAGTQTGVYGGAHYGMYRNLSFNGNGSGYTNNLLGDINYLINNVTTIGGNSSFTNHYNWLRNDAAVNFSTNWSNNYNEFKNSSTGTMTSVINNYSNFVNASTGIITSAYGNYTTGSNSSTGTITNLYGLYTDSPVNGTGTITSAYGVYIKDQSVGTNTSAYGVYIEDQAGAATNNYGIYSAGTTNYNYFGGKVGIGKTAPGQSLDVVGQVRIENLASSTSTWDIFTNDGTAAGICDSGSGTTGDSICFRSSTDGGGASGMRINSGGNTVVPGGSTQSGNPDIAEQIEVDDPTIVPGDILVATTPLPDDGRDIYKRAQATKSHGAYERGILGVVSTNPGRLIAIKDAMTLDDSERSVDGARRALAVAGRMPVNIAPTSDAIKPGDFLTSSDTPGKAMKATRSGPVIGKALEAWNPPTPAESPKPNTLMLLAVTWYNPADTSLLVAETTKNQRQLDELQEDSKEVQKTADDYDALKVRLQKAETAIALRSSN